MRVVGIDLAGKIENPTGFCSITDSGIDTMLLYTDEEIIAEVKKINPDCIAIDAPLWLPRFGAWRPSEEKLLKRGFKPLSTLLPTMRILAIRASKLSRTIIEMNYKVVEVFSSATEQVLGLSKEPRKNKDEYDALLCALTAKAYLEGNYEDVDGIILPK